MLIMIARVSLPLMCLFACVTFGVSSSQAETYRATETHMGTRFTITLAAESRQSARAGFAAAFARIEELDAKLSDYQADSELNRLCRQSPTEEPVVVSEDLFLVLTTAQAISRKTEGAFDVTIGPLTRLWRAARKEGKLPDPEQLAEARQAVGFGNVKLSRRGEGRLVSLSQPNMQLDLGGIAKGYALDEAIAALHEVGIDRALVDGGGDLACMSPTPQSKPWRLGVAPLEPKAPASAVVGITRGGLATSGDAWQFVEIDGKRYSHILDPATGLGLQQRSSVTVLAPNGMLADAWASAVSVMGPQRGLKLINKLEGFEAIVVISQADEPQVSKSHGIEKLLIGEKKDTR